MLSISWATKPGDLPHPPPTHHPTPPPIWDSVCYEILFVHTPGKVSDSGKKLSASDLFWDVDIRPSQSTECQDEGVA